MQQIPKSAGVGLIVYGVGVTAAFMASGAPGGAYTHGMVAAYVDPDHWPAAFATAYLGALASLGVLVFGQALRRLAGMPGDLLWGLCVAATATSVTGAFVIGGVDVAMAEGGGSVQSGVGAPVIYAITEIGNLLLVCAPALFVGVVGLVLAARSPVPRWLRGFGVIAGVCGILAPWFFTYFVFVAWTITLGVRLIRPAARGARKEALSAA